MIFDKNQQNNDAWRTQIHLYQKNKRTKKPFGKNISLIQHVTHQQIKNKQCMFNPILQTYQKQIDQQKYNQLTQQKRAKSLMNHLKQTLKYQKNFDIVNLKSNQSYIQKIPTRKLGPIRNAYNVINNQKIPEYYFENRQIKLPIERQKKLLDNYKKQFDIVSNIYKQNHQQKIKDQIQKQSKKLTQKYWKTHHYDPIYGKCYDNKKQQQYQKQRIAKEQIHGIDAESKLPPSYVYRQPLIVDYTKPLPQTLKILDQRNANAKKRFHTKYIVLDQYQKRNIEEQVKHEQIVKNHVHFGRVLDQKSKQFDIVTNKPYKQTRAQELYGKKLQVPSWQVLIKQAAKNPKSTIKSGGFI